MRLASSLSLAFVLFLTALHFRPPLSNPTRAESFDPDMVELQLRTAPKDAQTVFLGDSITDRWRFRPVLWQHFGRAANLGIGGAKVANILWLAQSGKLAAFHPTRFVLRIGTNDLSGSPHFWERRPPSVSQVNAGIKAICESLRRQFPNADIIVMPYPPPPQDLAPDGVHLNDAGYEDWKTFLDRSIATY